jgi:hypothetical protein
MSGLRKTLQERIEEELKRQEESRASLADLKARARELDRRLDVRRKIILGAAVQAHAKANSRFREELRRAVLAAVNRPQDMAVLPEFFEPSESQPRPPERPTQTSEQPPHAAAPHRDSTVVRPPTAARPAP